MSFIPFSTPPLNKFQSGTTTGLVVKSGAGYLHKVLFGAISNNAVITLYDNTTGSGAVIWASGTLSASSVPTFIDFEKIAFSTGLTLVISGASANVNVIYE